jgi:hypothetical protein
MNKEHGLIIHTSIFVEFIRNYIIESITEYRDKIDSNIEFSISKFKLNLFHKREMESVINNQILNPYEKHLTELTTNINSKIMEYFEVCDSAILKHPVSENIFNYSANHKLVEEYNRTEKLTETTIKLINKTLDYTLLNCINMPLLKKFTDALSIGDIILSYFNYDLKIYKKRHKDILINTVAGINKNISIRIQNVLLQHYSPLIYDIAEEMENKTFYEKVI